MSVCALLLLSCMHSLELGLDLGNRLDQKEGERPSAQTRVAELPKESDGLYLMTSVVILINHIFLQHNILPN